MEFILLMDRIKCWYNTPLQILTEAPALDSLTIFERGDAADILQILFHTHGYLRELIFICCGLGEDYTGLLDNIVSSFPDLEVLKLEGCGPLTWDGYCLISHLKKLSELTLPWCEVHYVYVKLLETHVCIREHMYENTPRNTFYIFRQERNVQHF
jgi:hypothetical protein